MEEAKDFMEFLKQKFFSTSLFEDEICPKNLAQTKLSIFLTQSIPPPKQLKFFKLKDENKIKSY